MNFARVQRNKRFYCRRMRPMKQLANTEQGYGAVAIALHWLMAVLLTTLIGSGLYMV